MFLVVDIGGTITKYAVVNELGDFVRPFPASFPTPRGSLVQELIERFLPLIDEYDLVAAGVSIAANVDDDGKVLYSTNLSIDRDYPLGASLSEELGVPVVVENDGNCAALAVSRTLPREGNNPLIVLTLGTGVGGGVIINDELLKTANGGAAELGHIVVDPRGPRCACGKWGCLEAFVGEAGLVSRYNQESRSPVESAAELFHRLTANEQLAIDVVSDTGDILGKGLAIMSDIIAPQAIYVVGGLAGLGDYLLTAARESLAKNCFLRHVDAVPQVMRLQDSHLLPLKGAWVLII